MTESAETPDTIRVFGAADVESDRGVLQRLGELRYGRAQIPVELLQQRVTEFLQSMGEVLEKVPAAMSGFELDQVQVTAELSAKGTVSLLGAGGELAGKGGLVFTFKRRPAD